MLEDVIKTKEINNKIVSILLYSIEKENFQLEENHHHYYEIRISEKNDPTCTKWYTDSEYYQKRSAIIAFNQVCKEIKQEMKNTNKEICARCTKKVSQIGCMSCQYWSIKEE